jgi:RNA ligase partner protein
MSRKKIVLDTSVFVNPASSHAFGRSPTEAFIAFLEIGKRIDDVDFYMPPSIYMELMHFCEEAKIPDKLALVINKKAPKKNELRVPGIFIYQLVDSMRDRVDRGLRLAERHVREALSGEAKEKAASANLPAGAGPEKKVRPDAYSIGLLRESYRRIMREGVLDSKADVDLLLLAYELDAMLVSADLGVVEWAENLGLTILTHEKLKPFLSEHAK